MNINTVSREELIRNFQLDGATADAIVRARQKVGGAFESWAQLKAAAGIDQAVVERLHGFGLTVLPLRPRPGAPELPVVPLPAPARDPEPEGLPEAERPGIVDRGRGGVADPGRGGKLPNDD
jgi:Helix-hairpin-helix motif